MEQYGLCKIECTQEQRDAVIAFHQRLLKQQKECERRINSHEFDITKVNRFLFFKSRSTILDMARVKAEYPDLFVYASPFRRNGFTGIYMGRKFRILTGMVNMLMTKGDVYLTPEQCDIFRSAGKGGDSDAPEMKTYRCAICNVSDTDDGLCDAHKYDEQLSKHKSAGKETV
jgi:hypothetical protein